jgi:hypothetical protein
VQGDPDFNPQYHQKRKEKKFTKITGVMEGEY